ncbi:MAG TPA: PDZ domain-containing protein [Pirellulaceae bacterium]
MSLSTVLLLLFFCCPALAQNDLQSQEEVAIRAAVEKVAPSVVRIETIGGLERVGRVLVNTGPTTGLVVSEDGYVISSAFNFIQQPTSILVTLPSGARAAAKIVARDESRMLVLLKVSTSETLPVPTAVPRADMTVGQWGVAVGRTYDPAEVNVSVGVISATNRIWSTAIQTDAKISPANYGGPLIDVQSRVLGVLVPLSPQKGGGEVAGAEWYDSGIGFAVPLTDILEQLPTLKQGKDLHPGVMGISLKPGDTYATPAELAAAQAGSPAYKAGLRKGDTIVEIDGTKIERQSQLKHALGPRYAGDKVHLVYIRGKEKPARREIDVELTDKLIPYEHPFLGVLPLRDGEGVRVRFVYPDSPAAKAGIKPGDRIAALGDEAIKDAEQLRTLLANVEPKAKITLKIARGSESLSLELTPGKLPTDIPGELPAATGEPPPPPNEKPATGIVEIKLPEAKNECIAYVPENYHAKTPHGVLVVLSGPGKIDREKFESRWKTIANDRQLIILAPMSESTDKWQATETEFIRKTLDDVVSNFNIDPTRISVYGYQSGGSMAYLAGFEHTDRIRAIIAVDSVPPSGTRLPDADPIRPLAFVFGQAEKSTVAPLMKTLTSALESMKFPVTKIPLGEKPRDLNDDELTQLGRWLDTLDRI